MNFRHLILAFILLAATGCGLVNDSLSNCPSEEESSLVLDMHFIDDEGENKYSQRMDSLHIYLFDQEGFLKQVKMVSNEEIKRSQRVSIDVQSGRYQLVCWGNINREVYVNLQPGSSIIGGTIEHVTPENKFTKGVPLYYAPYNKEEKQEIEVVEGKENRADVYFRPAHVTLKVSVEGYDHNVAEDSGINPYIEVAKLDPKYCFRQNNILAEEKLSYLQQTTSHHTREGENDDLSDAIFYTPRLTMDNCVELYLKPTTTDEPIYTVFLQEELRKQQIDIEKVKEHTVLLRIIFSSTGVEVKLSVSPWSDELTYPEID